MNNFLSWLLGTWSNKIQAQSSPLLYKQVFVRWEDDGEYLHSVHWGRKDERNPYLTTNKKLKVAILGIGYADGISRVLSNKGNAYFKNKTFKIIGRVSMDSITVDISKNDKLIKVGDYMEIINHSNGIDKIANQCNTICDEILTSISKRVKRVYI